MISVLDMETTGDVMNLFETIVYLEQQMSEVFSQTFEKELFNLQVPDVIMENLLEKIQSEMDSQVFIIQFYKSLKAIYKKISANFYIFFLFF